MTSKELIEKIETLNEWTDMIEEAKKEAEAIKDSIKQFMEEEETEELECGQYIIRNTSVLTSKFNTKKFKEDFGDMYRLYCKEVASKRFSISC